MLEEYLCGDLTLAEAAEIERAARVRPDLDDYLRERRAEKAAFLAEHPRLKTPAPRTRRAWTPWVLAFATATAAVAVSLPSWLWETPVVRAKGGLAAQLVVRRQGRTFAWRRDVLLRAGDRVRLTVESQAGGFLTVVGRDRRGYATLYDALPVEPGTFTAPGSMILDDADRDETWWVVLTETPEADVLGPLRRGEEPRGAVAVLELHKEPAP
jgi:hypothetical protein